MKKFNFKLGTLLRYRELLEDKAETAYREALARRNHQLAIIEENRRRRNEAALALKKTPAGHPFLPLITLTDHYLNQLSQLIEEQALFLLELEHNVQEKLSEYQLRHREAEAIRRLREKQLQKYLLEMDKEEQKMQDDLFIARWPGVMES